MKRKLSESKLTKMLPAYQRLAEKEENESANNIRNRLYTVSFSKFSTLTVTLPLASFLFCVGYSLYFFNERSTATHCHVKNYLPSISAAIGSFQPQAIIWQLSIILHFPARLTITWMYLQNYQRNIRKNRKSIAYLACIINVIENFTLLGLSLYTSNDSYGNYQKIFLLSAHSWSFNQHLTIIFISFYCFHFRNPQELFLYIHIGFRNLYGNVILFKQKSKT